MTAISQLGSHTTCSHVHGNCHKEQSSFPLKMIGNALEQIIEFGESVVGDCAKGAKYVSAWVGLSNCSAETKEKAEQVKALAIKTQLFTNGCETLCAAKSLVASKMETVSDGIEKVGAFIGAGSELIESLCYTNVINVGDAEPFIGGLGSFAWTAVSLKSINDIIQDPAAGRDIARTMLKMARSVTLLALSVLCGVAAYLSATGASSATVSLGILSLATTALALKVTSCFCDRLLPAALNGAKGV